MARGTPPGFPTHGTGVLEKGTEAPVSESARPAPAGAARDTALRLCVGLGDMAS